MARQIVDFEACPPRRLFYLAGVAFPVSTHRAKAIIKAMESIDTEARLL